MESKHFVDLFEGYTYNFENGPCIDTISHIERGFNCQLGAHIMLEELGLSIPKSWRSSEIYFDQSIFTHIDTQESGLAGDIYLFGKAKMTIDDESAKKLHLAVLLDPVAMHLGHFCRINDKQQGFAIWDLESFSHSRRYRKLYGIRRPHPKPEFINYNIEALFV